MLAAVVDDIIEGTMTGFESVDASGDEIVKFLDVWRYVGDYPAVSHTLDASVKPASYAKAYVSMLRLLPTSRSSLHRKSYVGYSCVGPNPIPIETAYVPK